MNKNRSIPDKLWQTLLEDISSSLGIRRLHLHRSLRYFFKNLVTREVQGTRRVALTLTMLAEKLQHRPLVNVSFLHDGVVITTGLGLAVAQFAPLWFGIPEHFWFEQNQNSALMDFFAPRWMSICEQLHATYGFFSGFESLSDDEHMLNVILHAIEQHKVALLANYWLAYLGPDLASFWTEQDRTQLRSDSSPHRLPSGALFFRSQATPLG